MLCTSGGCVAVQTHPPYPTHEACVEAIDRMEDHAYRTAMDGILGLGIILHGPVSLEAVCLINT